MYYVIMLDHHIQRKIVYRLALTPSLRFTELKPDTLENKLFTYHLKKVISAGLVEKNKDGRYALTSEGRLFGVNVLENTEALHDRAYSVLFLAIRRKSDKAWLLYKRTSHPLFGKSGFMHAVPNAQESSLQTATRVCKEKTGLDATFSALGGGFFRVFEGEKLESFTNFTLLVCNSAVGEITSEDETAEYYWSETIDLDDKILLPNMKILLELYDANETFFIEKDLRV
jgi:ADP-ribose pyrophosphatase YjhB (NUDIX family)